MATHSITSSARASSVGGTSRPSALAVLRLMISSYFVGACTGRSPGFSPRSMRSTYDAARRHMSTRSAPRRIAARPIAITALVSEGFHQLDLFVGERSYGPMLQSDHPDWRSFTLWHFDASERAPSTASKPVLLVASAFRPDVPRSRHNRCIPPLPSRARSGSEHLSFNYFAGGRLKHEGDGET
jgi:hypothetical protein